MTAPLTVFGILVNHREEIAPEMQEVITKHGGNIICRMGVPSPSKGNGLITLIYEGELKQVDGFQKELEELSGITVKTMSFPQ